MPPPGDTPSPGRAAGIGRMVIDQQNLDFLIHIILFPVPFSVLDFINIMI
jgi:hypothetical protein